MLFRLTSLACRALVLTGFVGMGFGGASPSLARQSTVRFERLTMDDGLSQASAIAVLQDRTGFLWVGTQDGLNRFDGYGFTAFHHDPGDSTSLSGDFIQALHETPDGTFWIGTRDHGLNRFVRDTETFVRYDLAALLPQSDAQDSTANDLFALGSDPSGVLWLGTAGGLIRFDPNTGAAFRIPFGEDAPARVVKALAVDAAGQVWAGTSDGRVFRHAPATTPGVSAELAFIVQGEVLTLHVDARGRLWAGAFDHGVYVFDPATGDLQVYRRDTGDPRSLVSNQVRVVYSDRRGDVWVGTREGLSRLDAGTGRFRHFRHNPANPHSLSHDEVLTVYEDRTGVRWIGTWNGLNRLAPSAEAFRLYGYDPEVTGLRNANVAALHEARDGTLWVGTLGGGLSRLDPGTGRFRTYAPGGAEGLRYKDVSAVFEDRRAMVWAGTWGGGLHRLDPATNRFRVYTHDSTDATSLIHNSIASLYETRDGTLWVGTTRGGGLHRYHPTTDRFTRYRKHDHPDSLGSDYVWPLLEDHTGTFWVGTIDGGLHQLDRATGRFRAFRHDPADPTSLSSDFIYTLFEARDGTLWVGTTEGLNRFDRDTETFRRYTVSDGLAHSHIAGLLEDAFGRLWISTNHGLNCFDPKTDSITTYTERAGLQNNRFYVGAMHQTARGALLFGGPGGFNVINPALLRPNDAPPPVVLTGFEVHNQPFDLGTAPPTVRAISLKHDENFFTFSFAALDFTDVPLNRYRYKLEGLNKNWIESGARRRASYTSVPPNAYVLRVQAANNEGVWNEAGLAIPVVVHPPFWATWWFRVLMILTFVGLLYAAYAYRVRQLLAVEGMRFDIAAALHTDLAADLGQLSTSTYLLKGKDPRDPTTQTRLDNIGELAREMALKVREIVWLIRIEYDTLPKLISKMEDLPDTLFAGLLRYTFTAEPEPPPDRSLSMALRLNVYLLYKEALNNILKHAEATHVAIRMSVRQGRLHLSIEDDGVGFDPEAASSGHGIGLMRKHADALGGELTLTSQPGAGTRLILVVRL